MKRTDAIFRTVCLICGLAVLLLACGFLLQLLIEGAEAWKRFGLGFIFSSEWNPARNEYGALPAIAGTLSTTALALVFALPLAFAAALYIVDAPPLPRAILGHAVDLLGAIPSVIYGMWALFVLTPIMQNHVQKFMVETLHLGSVPFIGDKFNGFGILTASTVLAIMILPYICGVMRDVLRMTPPVLREAAFGIGCTRFEAAFHVILKYGKRGLFGGVFIGLGRALGETMAVLFVIGNLVKLPDSIFDSAVTIPSMLANNFAEAEGLQKSALFALGLILFAMCFGIQFVSWRFIARPVCGGAK